jgi:hypothetical protein
MGFGRLPGMRVKHLWERIACGATGFVGVRAAGGLRGLGVSLKKSGTRDCCLCCVSLLE